MRGRVALGLLPSTWRPSSNSAPPASIRSLLPNKLDEIEQEKQDISDYNDYIIVWKKFIKIDEKYFITKKNYEKEKKKKKKIMVNKSSFH